MKHYYNKLVRDRIPEVIKARGGSCEIKIVSDKDKLLLLKKKLVEESKEVVLADKGEILGELADVLQILRSVSKLEKIKFVDVERKLSEKVKSNGSYNKGLFLIWSDKPKGFGDKKKK